MLNKRGGKEAYLVVFRTWDSHHVEIRVGESGAQVQDPSFQAPVVQSTMHFPFSETTKTP